MKTAETMIVRITGTIRRLAGSVIRHALMLLITSYRYLLSPVLGPRCRFLPTCSEYASEALERHGIVRGGWLALCRIGRCHPVKCLGGSSGYDPVPPRTSGTE